ncbi:MAG: prephenate dehydratase [Nitrososphaeraceae archaeon]|nr:prephenate dehydratase [Nitrososphaeraceae archaeon]
MKNKHTVIFQGEKGAYSEMAVLKFFPDAITSPMRSFHEIFESIINDENEIAVIPIENSIEGSVNENYDLLLQNDIKIVGEIFQRINHCLIVNQKHKKIFKVYSHPQALAQCREYINKRGLEPIPTYDTAGAVKIIKENKWTDAAAIASKRAGELYNMKIIDEGIEDRKNNFTRFFVISRKIVTKSTGNDRTSIIFGLEHAPGSLFRILNEFAIESINLTKIESRPTKETPWEYYFYVDLEGHHTDKKIKNTLEKVKNKAKFFKLLGSYKRGEF